MADSGDQEWMQSHQTMKRLFDIAVSAVLLAVLMPCLILISVLIRRDSPGRAIFCQTRIGRGGRPFTMFKFRTMVENAAQLGSHSTASDDPRITGIGGFLRRTSLDELPQLANVLLGHMSLVGPRPEVPIQREMYSEDEWQQRHRVRPGITGLAQAKLRSAATPEQRKELDLSYAQNANLILDLKILVWTVTQLRRGV